jgi:hypothetical protein
MLPRRIIVRVASQLLRERKSEGSLVHPRGGRKLSSLTLRSEEQEDREWSLDLEIKIVVFQPLNSSCRRGRFRAGTVRLKQIFSKPPRLLRR